LRLLLLLLLCGAPQVVGEQQLLIEEHLEVLTAAGREPALVMQASDANPEVRDAAGCVVVWVQAHGQQKQQQLQHQAQHWQQEQQQE
jgi:hypothetical protein